MANNPVVHFYTAESLLSGNYDGQTCIDEVLKSGNFGLGTLNGLKGELIILDGVAYAANGDGNLQLVEKTAKTPFTTITNFEKHLSVEIHEALYADLVYKMPLWFPSAKYYYAIQIEGRFGQIDYRGSWGITSENPDLLSVIKNSGTITEYDLEGVLVGFFVPDHANGVNIPGFHFHFVDISRRFGGHVVDFNIESGKVFISQKKNFKIK